MTAVASWQMRPSSVERSSDSLSVFAARVSADWRAAWRACSSARAEARERGGGGAGERGREVGVGLAGQHEQVVAEREHEQRLRSALEQPAQLG